MRWSFLFLLWQPDQAARHRAEGVNEVLEQLDCGFGNAQCGIQIEFSICSLAFSIRNPQSAIRNMKYYILQSNVD
jgi:hypothetical protein